jgi:WD40 repeat protein
MNGEIVQFPDFMNGDGGKSVIVQSHFDGELWAVDVHPTQHNQFVTAGEDNMLAIWDKKAHSLMKKANVTDEKKGRRSKKNLGASTLSRHGINQCARAVAYAPDGATVAVGTNDGRLSIFSDFPQSMTPTVIDMNKSGKTEQWIEAISFAPNGKVLGVGTHQGNVLRLINTETNQVESTITGASSAVLSVDFSDDSQFAQYVTQDYELLFVNVTDPLSDSKRNPNAAEMKDVNWATQTGKIGWWVDGIWEDGMDGSDINRCDRSPDGKLIASGDDWGRVNLYRNPVGADNEKASFASGHSSFVQNVKFTKDGQHLLSAGGFDKCIMQWKIN